MRHKMLGKKVAMNVLETGGKQCIDPFHNIGSKQATHKHTYKYERYIAIRHLEENIF